MPGVIDFRARPNLPAFAEYLAPRLEQIEHDTRGTFGAYRAPVESADEFVERLEAAGVEMAVVAARSRSRSGKWAFTSDVLLQLLDAHPQRLVGLVGLDVTDVEAALDEVKPLLGHPGVIGVSFDGFQLGTDAADQRLYPIYDLCGRSGAIVAVTLGGLPGIPVPLESARPLAIDRAAQEFPDTVMVASHAGWPFTQEMVAVAWRNPNVYFENSFYHAAPGASLLAEAARSMVGEKMLYASAYPFASLTESLAEFRALGLDAGLERKISWETPQRLIGAARARLAQPVVA